MKDIAVLGSKIQGTTSGEHHGHTPGHGPCTLTGEIVGNCSTKMFINGKPVALVGSITSEDDCCGPGSGSIAVGSSKLFINGVAVARVGDKVSPHNGSAVIITGSEKAGAMQ